MKTELLIELMGELWLDTRGWVHADVFYCRIKNH